MAAPLGNQNAAKAKRWAAAIERALERRSRVEGQEELDALADAFIDEVKKAGINGFKELGDRLDGRPAQSLELGSDPDKPLRGVLKWGKPE